MADSTVKKNSEASKIVSAVVLFVLGVLFCLEIATATIGIVIGAAMAGLGLINLIFLAKNKKSFVSPSGFANSVLIALGIVFITKQFLSVFVGLIPYVLIVVGFVVLIDAFLAKFVRKAKIFVFVVELVIAVASVTFGFCLLFIEKFASAASIVFGVFLILSALSLFVKAVKKSK